MFNRGKRFVNEFRIGLVTFEQTGVGFIPLRTLIAGSFEEETTEFLLTLVETSGAERTWRLHWLKRVQQVVHFDIVLRTAFFYML